MNRFARSLGAGVALALAAVIASCEAKPVALSPAAEAVEVGETNPAAGATNLGEVESVSGEGCGARGEKGTRKGALADLRNQTEARGGDYVRVTKETVPHVEGGCYDVRFTIRGIAFRTHAAAPEPAPAVAVACTPLCSPGYACEVGVCRAQCNPACAPNETCGQDRTCRAPSP